MGLIQRLLCLLTLHDWLYDDSYINTLVEFSIKVKCAACGHFDYHPVSKFKMAFKAKGEAVFHPDLSKRGILRGEGTVEAK